MIISKHPHRSRVLVRAATVVALTLGGGVVGPAALAPGSAQAAVREQCGPPLIVQECNLARQVALIWQNQIGPWPQARQWWTAGAWKIRSGGRYENRDRQLPQGNWFEYDVQAHRIQDNPRNLGLRRLVRNTNNGAVYYTPDHYRNFYRI